MIFKLNSDEIKLLQAFSIDFQVGHHYSEDEAFALVDQIYDAEIFYAQNSEENETSFKKANLYANLADKIQTSIK